MEELHKIAKACYNAASKDVKKLAEDFFKAMDHDCDGRVSLHEFLAFMREAGYPQMKNFTFFRGLSKNGRESLDFFEVATLYYIIQSGRPFCEGCSEFINGVFFTCVKCFDRDGTTFNLCFRCFQGGTYKHNHNEFLDNFVLLEAKRKAALKKKSSSSDTMQDKSSSSDTKQDKSSSSDTKQGKSSSSATKQDKSSSSATKHGKSSSSGTKQDKSSSSDTKQDKSSSSDTKQGKSSSSDTKQGKSSSSDTKHGKASSSGTKQDKSSSSDTKQGKSSSSDTKHGKASSSGTKQDKSSATQELHEALEKGYSDNTTQVFKNFIEAKATGTAPTTSTFTSIAAPTTSTSTSLVIARTITAPTTGTSTSIAAPTAGTSKALAIVPVNNKPKTDKLRDIVLALEAAFQIANVASIVCAIL